MDYFRVIGIILLFNTPAYAQAPPIDFAGFGFGVGFAYLNAVTDDIVDIDSVRLVDDRVFIDKSLSNQTSMIFESHVTFQTKSWLAVGPYFSIISEQDNFLQGVGGGVLFELNRPSFNEATSRMEPSPVSFNIGVGVAVLFDQHVLRPGLQDGGFIPPNVNPTMIKEKAVLQVVTVLGFGSPF